MKGKRIVFTEPGKAALEEFNVRDPKPGEVQVRVIYTLISAGTEKAYLSNQPNTSGRFPTVPGYSSVGYVTKVGSNVRDFKVNDRVFVGYGGHASYNIKTVSEVVKIPDNVAFEEAVFTRVASFPLLAIRRSGVEIGESVVIVGLGMLGLFGVQIARLCGALPLIAVGNRELRQQKARDYGANYVFSPDDPQLTEKINDITKRTNGVKGANVVIETSGSEDGLIKCLEYTSMYFRVMINGCNRVMTKPVNFYKYVHLRGGI